MGAIIRRRQLINNTTLLYAYGAEAPSTGGWIVAGYNRSTYHPIGVFTKGARSLNYTQTTGGGSREEWYKKGWATTNKVTITGQKNLCVTFANDFTIPRAGNAYPSMVGIALVSTLTDTNTGQELSGKIVSQIYNWGTEIKAGKVYKLDVSSVSGDAFVTVYYGVYMAEAPYQANISKIWLEAKGETQGTEIPEDFYDHGALPIMPDKGTLKTVGPDDIVSFPDGNGTIFEQFKANIEPLQSFNGYASPWPAGGGKNKLAPTQKNAETSNGITFTPNADGSITVNGTATGLAVFDIVTTQTLANGSYIMNGCPTGGGSTTYGFYLNDAGDTSLLNTFSDIGSGGNVTITSDGIYRPRLLVRSGVTVNNLVFKPMIRLSTVEDATFAPYENICPITGWTGAEAVVTGKNLFDKTADNTSKGYIADSALLVDGSITANALCFITEYIPVKPSVAYTLQGLTGNAASICFYTSDKAYISGVQYLNNSTRTMTTPATAAFARFTVAYSFANLIQLEEGSTASNYEAFGAVYPVIWTDEAGTVYKGSVDLVSGVLTVTHKGKTLSPSDPWALGSSDRFYLTVADAKVSTGSLNTTIATNLESTDWNHLPLTAYGIAPIYGTGGIGIHITGITTLPDFLTWLTNNGGFAVYELATPTTYQLTPTEVRTLLGANNCWTDTGATEIKYYGI